MRPEFLEIGTIVNTHGVRGEMKLAPRDVDAALLRGVKALYIDGRAYRPVSARVHKDCLLLTLPEVTDLDGALAFKGKAVSIRREDVSLPEGVYFPAELIGLSAVDAESGAALGTLVQVLPYPAHDVYVIRGEKEFMVPAVPAFIQAVDLERETIQIHVWEGLI